ncbi:tetratricopeptide repeat protein [Flavobacterium sp. TP390]|uniref:Tetratricopeptide repeat protein n=1 Tax=Flavobacterium profundi TaxID=1774945 RepID=A0A6I4IGZ9_9FLAO|nr:tetratricopeptide repeat protein [Flavobacterium profundi]MVO08898.1 tetratricopeptide repeat protein [Flavobacterium profundi]
MRFINWIKLILLVCVQNVCSQYIKQADSLVNMGKLDKAIEIYTKDSSRIKFYKTAKVYEIRGDLDLAKEYYNYYLDEDALNKKVNYDYALLLLELNRFKEAEIIFKELVKEDNNSIYNYYLGNVLEKQSSLAEAKFYYEKSVTCDSLFLKSNYRLALLLTNENSLQEAKKICNRFLNNKIINLEMLKLRAQINFNLKDYFAAIDDFEMLIERNQDEKFIFEKLAISYYEIRQYEKSRILFSELINEKDDAQYYIYRAKCYGFLNLPEKAEEDMVMAINLRTFTFENEYFSLGYFFQKAKNYKKAIYYYNKTLKQDKNHLEANYHLITIKDYLGNSPQESIQNYKKFLLRFSNLSNEKKEYINQRLTVLNNN